MSSDEPPHPGPLTDERWAYLVSPLRPYFPKGEEQDRELSLRRKVMDVTALFRDTGTDTDEWESRGMELLLAAMPSVASKEDRLMQALTFTLPYLGIAREQETPLPAVARERIREVQKKATALTEAISNVLNDPWVYVVVSAEVMMVAAQWREASSEAGSEPSPPPPELSDRDRLLLLMDAFETGPAFLAPLCEGLKVSLSTLSVTSEIAGAGLAWLEGLQTRGRPPEAGARLRALFIALIARQCAPAPPRGGGVRKWREAIADFVCGVLAEAGLPSVTREFLEDSLK
jgi:hypothetical protein